MFCSLSLTFVKLMSFSHLEESTNTPPTVAPWYEEYDYSDGTFAAFQSVILNRLYQTA